MRTILACTALLALLTACTAEIEQAEQGQQLIEDAQNAVDEANSGLCVQCGDGCIPKELAPMTSCLASTETFSCVYVDNACKRSD